MPITQFNGQHGFLSNFYPAAATRNGISYKTVEHGFQAAKAAKEHEADWVAQSPTAADAKKRGRKVTRREDWDEVRNAVMLELLRSKFSEPMLRDLLNSTGDEELIEGNWWGDTYWGVCNEVGENWLGKLLMQVRGENRCP